MKIMNIIGDKKLIPGLLGLCMIVCLISISTTSNAQNYDVLDVEVIQDGKVLKNPFTGGFESPIFSPIDINLDGIEDLIVFDRAGGTLSPFINDGLGNDTDSYTYAPQYKNIFPCFTGWLLAVDFDKDGIPDLFGPQIERAIDGAAVYKGYIDNAGQLAFERFIFGSFTSGAFSENVIPFEFPNGTSQLYISTVDIPALIDADGDNDLDIFTFTSGGSHMAYYKNISVESGFGTDSLLYVLEDDCWGRFFESGLSEEISLSDSMHICSNGIIGTDDDSDVRHAGSTVLVFDNDADDDLDMVLGDLANDGLVFLTNNGTTDEAWVTEQDIRFPDYDVPANMQIFLSAFFLDVDNDDRRDLLVSVNQVTTIQNVRNIWYYKNEGEDNAPIFIHQKDDFLAESTLDFGSFTDPTFVDYNQDGLMDIVVAYKGEFVAGATDEPIGMAYLENVGTINTPKFEVKDKDFLNFSEYSSSSNRISPTFGDLDGDDDLDLLIGDFDGYLYSVINDAGPGNPISLGTPIWQYQNIKTRQGNRPFIVDINEDGLNDMVIGLRTEKLNLDTVKTNLDCFLNIGTATDPEFDPDPISTNNIAGLGKVNTRRFCAPAFYETQDDYVLFTGSLDGSIGLYSNIKNNIDGFFDIDETKLGMIKEGENSAISVADIDNDGWLEIVIGNKRGGISIYNTIVKTNGEITSTQEEVNDDTQLISNPVSDWLNFNTEIHDIQIFNMNGQLIDSRAGSAIKMDITHLESGCYAIQYLDQSDKQRVELFVKI